MTTALSVQRTIDTAQQAVFAVIADPRRHREMDGSDTVRGTEATGPITRVGEVFRMDMHHRDAGDYQTDNHVTAFEPGRVIAWRTSEVDAEPAGWEWIWRLDPIDDSTTAVSLTYDWSDVHDPAVLALVPFPAIPLPALEQSLVGLAALVARPRP